MNSYRSNVMISTKTFLRFAILFSGIFLLANQDLKATHIVGGDMTYRCLGNNIYEIRLTMRRDCFQGAPNAQFDDPASIGIFDGTTHQPLLDLIGYPGGELTISLSNNDTLNEFLHSDCSVVSGDVCVHTTMYIKNIVLPYRATGYTLAYQRCCRNGTLNNIVDPLNTGMTIVAELSATAQLECNSSPQLLAYPSIYVCVNKDIDFDAHAVDFENDSLVYSLCTPYAGGTIYNNKPQPPPPPPYGLVVWKPPYSLANLLGGSNPLKINPSTGRLSGRPISIGQYVIGICVTAYKRGTNIITGVTRRDFQYNVRMCRDVPVANFTAPSLDCNNDNLTVTFNNQSILADEYLWIFDYGNPNSDTSILFNPSYTYLHEGFFNVALIVRDSGMFCHDTIIHQVGVFNTQINTAFTYDVSSCDENGIVLNVHDQTTGFNPNFPAASYQWLMTVSPSGQIIPSTLQNPTFQFDIDGISTVCLALVVTSTNGCSATHTECFPVRELSLVFPPGSGHICNGDSTLLLDGEPGLNYSWSPTAGLFYIDSLADIIAFPNITTEYLLTVTDGLCLVTGHTVVEVQQLPVLAFSSQTDCKSLTANFTNSSTGNLYHWDFGFPGNPGSNDTNPVFTFPDSGIYTIVLSSRDGCDVSTSQQITVNAIAEHLDNQTINCFQPTISLNPDTIQGYLYIWSNGSHDANPSVTVEDDTTFYVTISSPGLPGCEIVDSIRVIIPTPFTVDAGSDVTNCKFDDVTLTATLIGISPEDVVFTWKVHGNAFSASQTIVVNPSATTTYYVTATDSLGCSKTDSVRISKSDPGFVVHVFPEGDTAYCDQQIITLNATSIAGVSFEWFDANNVNIGSGSTIEGTPKNPSCYYVIGTDLLGCQNMDSVCLTPTYLSLDITGGQGICLDGEATICVTNNHPEQNLNYLWNTDAVTSCITVSPSVTTLYTVIVTNADLGCDSTLSSPVTVHLFDPLIISITSDALHDSIILSEDVQLEVHEDPNFGYIWTASNGENVPSVWNPVITPGTAGDITYTVTVTNEFGCTGVASITIRVANPPCNDEDIFLPTAFTPNGDGVNDVLYVRSNFISTMELHIYNRWGQQVFETTNQAKGWDGTFMNKGERLSPDVFGYYMNITCPNGRSFSKQGNITLLE